MTSAFVLSPLGFASLPEPLAPALLTPVDDDVDEIPAELPIQLGQQFEPIRGNDDDDVAHDLVACL